MLVHDDVMLDEVRTQGASLYLAELQLQNFRNYAGLRLQAGVESVVLVGPNGAGKTNILEAISLLSPGRGLRSAEVSELPFQRAVGAGWAVSAGLMRDGERRQLGTGCEVDGGAKDRRVVRIDGLPASQQALAGVLSVLWLTPAMEQLFISPREVRRKFLDRLTYSFFPDHATMVNRYEQAMRERNRLLEASGTDVVWLDAVEGRLAEAAVAIAVCRLDAMGLLGQAMSEMDAAFPRAHLRVEGLLEERLVGGERALEAEAWCREQWRGQRGRDRAAGRTLMGPHRSDLEARLDQPGVASDGQMAKLCSTGEQKALMLSITLAAAAARRRWAGCAPLLLLDEVVAHLDAGRREALFERLYGLGIQAWMTGVDVSGFAALEGRARFCRVSGGTVEF